MDIQDRSTPLLEKDESQFTNSAFQLDYEDSSSGYDSSDVSDTESVSSIESRDSYVNPVAFSRREEEVMNFRSTTSLCSNLRLILEMPELCDVTFLVGPNEFPVHGVRAILGTRSRVLYELILKHQSMRSALEKTAKKTKITGKTTVGISRSMTEKLAIPVKKYDPEVFRMLVEFVHCGSVNISEETVVGLYCGACQFKLPDLTSACLDFVERCLSGGRAEILLSSTRAFSQHRATKTLFDKIYEVLDRRYKSVR